MKCPLIAMMVVMLGGCVSTGGPRTFTETIPESTIDFQMVWIDDGFWMGRTEVTWDEYLLFCAFEARERTIDGIARPSKPLDTHPADRGWGLGKRPAVSMSKHAAQEYCRWLSQQTGRTYRLPTEDEWEAACADAGAGPDQAWTQVNSGGMTQETGTLAPNRHGLHDMIGNLWEYCENPWAPDQPKRAVMRGGSWKDDADSIDSSTRLRFDSDWVMDDPAFPPGFWWVPDGSHLGFRVVCDEE